jgi:hypothetical protein
MSAAGSVGGGMGLIPRTLISLVVSVLATGLGWFTAALIGTLIRPWYNGLGDGVLMALLLYALAFVFGVVGFVLSMVLLSRRRAQSST